MILNVVETQSIPHQSRESWTMTILFHILSPREPLYLGYPLPPIILPWPVFYQVCKIRLRHSSSVRVYLQTPSNCNRVLPCIHPILCRLQIRLIFHSVVINRQACWLHRVIQKLFALALWQQFWFMRDVVQCGKLNITLLLLTSKSHGYQHEELIKIEKSALSYLQKCVLPHSTL